MPTWRPSLRRWMTSCMTWTQRGSASWRSSAPTSEWGGLSQLVHPWKYLLLLSLAGSSEVADEFMAHGGCSKLEAERGQIDALELLVVFGQA